MADKATSEVGAKRVDEFAWSTIQRPSAEWLVMALLSGIGVFALLGWDPLKVPAPYRFGIPLALAIAVWWLPKWGNRLRVALRRFRAFDGLRTHIDLLESDLSQERRRTRRLCTFVAAQAKASDQFGITAVDIDERGETMLAIAGRKNARLESGMLFVVANPRTFELLGMFELSGVTTSGGMLRAIDDPQAVWWGRMREYAESHTTPQTDVVAYLLAEVEVISESR